ncbi:MAG: CPBP family intramembrane metalloprotease [Lachnospiraceae bacterium]|nr:CPBP family intramembrane glutamic endopeptidase [uncultured Acetatifactor sp.]MCI8799927.1 CPBP family intramembrane metalloprotease [Lachnospiraceae bacterium]
MDGMNGYMPVDSRREADELKAARKHFSMLGGMFVLGTILLYAVQLIPAIIVGVLRPEWLINPDVALLFSSVPMYLAGMPLLIVLVRIVPGDRLERHSMKAGPFLVSVIMCFAVMYASNIVGNIITTIIGILKGSAVDNVISDIATSTSMWLVFLVMVICAPIMEEYIFRKLIVDRTVRYGEGTAILVSGLMFGLFHGNLNQFAYAFSLGVFLAFLYVKTGNLKITIALHMIINFVGGVVSKWLMEKVNIDEYMRIVSEGMDAETLMSYVMEHLGGWIAYMVFLIFVIGMLIAGGILIVVNLVKKRFTLNRGMVMIPRGKRFRTVILNAGMIVYCLFWIVMIIVQLVM